MGITLLAVGLILTYGGTKLKGAGGVKSSGKTVSVFLMLIDLGSFFGNVSGCRFIETESGKSEEKMIEFSAELKSVQNAWIEGGLRKRLAVEVGSIDNPDAPETIEKRKFHVSRPAEWETKIKSAQQRQPRTTTTTTTKQVTE